MSRITIPQPKLGDVFVRDGQGYREKASVVALKEFSGGTWEATILCSSIGQIEINPNPPSANIFTRFDWKPEDWIFYQSASTFGPKGLIYIATSGTAAYPDDIDHLVIPVPGPKEHFKTWESRVKHEMGEDFWKWSGSNALIGKAWATHRGTGENEEQAQAAKK